MPITVYVDVLFLVNWVMDYLLLAITALLLCLRPRFFRMALSSFLGAMYAAVAFFIPLSFLSSLAAKLLLSAVMVLVSFGAKSLLVFLKRLGVFYLSSLALGGLGFALFATTGLGSRLGAVYANGVLYLNIPAYQIILASIVIYWLLHAAFCVLHRSVNKAKNLQRVTISRNGKHVQVTGLYDTGNFLSDPASGLGVILSEWHCVQPLFPENCRDPYQEKELPDFFTRLSCRSIGGEETLPAFYANVSSGRGKNGSFVRLIAVTRRELDPQKQYTILLPNDFKGADQNDGTFTKRRFYFSQAAVSVAKKLADRSGLR